MIGRPMPRRRLASVAVVSVAAAVLLAGGVHADAPPPLRPAWRSNLADLDFSLKYQPLEPTGPVDAGDGLSIFVGASDGSVRRIGLRDGRPVWSTQVGAGPEGRLTLAGDRLYLATRDGHVMALDATSGQEVWRERAGGAVVAGPVVQDGRLLFVTDEDNLRVLEADTGKWAWDYARETPDGFVLYGASEPTVHEGRVFMGFADGSLVSLMLDDGSLAWRQDLSAGQEEFTDVDTQPVVHGDRIFASSYSGGLHCLGRAKGELIWRTEIRGASATAVDGSSLLVPTANGQIISLDHQTGVVKYRRTLAEEGALGPLVRVGSWWGTPSRTLGLLLIDPASGRIVQRVDGGTGVSAPPVVVGDTVVVLSNGGWLYALKLR